MVKLHLVKEEAEAVVHTEASALVVGKCLARKLGIWKSARMVEVGQEDGSILGEDFVINPWSQIIDSSSVLGEFGMHAETLNM